MLTHKGFLFIGDPHVSSKRVGRRNDDYLSSVLGKLGQAAEVARERQLVPVILGDLFHRNDDNDLGMLSRLIRVLKSFPEPPYVLEGNHDKEQAHITESDALTVLELGGAVRVLNVALQEVLFDFEGKATRLLALPYGCEIPTEVTHFAGETVAISHHDLAFNTSYPGAKPLHPIINCATVVNGHMHDTKPSEAQGGTVWHNPGNIEPLSVDLAGHQPCVAVWQPHAPQAIELVFLEHNSDCFDLTGLRVDAAKGAALVEQDVPAASAFAALLQAQASADAARTDEASILLEDLEEILAAASVSEETKVLMQSLAADLVEAVRTG